MSFLKSMLAGSRGRRTALANRARLSRRGAVAVISAVVLVVLIGFVAMGVDVGYIIMTRTQLQSASDSAALAGGTELLPGLGVSRWKDPGEVAAAVKPRAVEYAAMHRAGDQDSVFADGERDVRLGKAVFDPGSGEWIQDWGVAPYNMVGVDLHRWDSGSADSGDGPLPLFFGRILGQERTEVNVRATAVILPTRGFRIEPGSGLTASIVPFAFRRDTWYRRSDAQRWFDAQLAGGSSPSDIVIDEWIEYQGVGDPNDSTDLPYYDRDRPLFYDYVLDSDGEIQYEEVVDPATGETVEKPVVRRDVLDSYFRTEVAPSEWEVTDGPDNVFEVDMYPEAAGSQALTAGNAGTIDLGGSDNSAADLERQILEGLNEEDWQLMEEAGIADGDGEFTFEEGTLTTEGDTGVTAKILKALETIIGEPRTMLLFEAEPTESGNNAVFTLSGFVGVSVVGVKKSGSPKHVWVQPANVVDETALPDYSGEIGDDDSIFTPLILIE